MQLGFLETEQQQSHHVFLVHEAFDVLLLLEYYVDYHQDLLFQSLPRTVQTFQQQGVKFGVDLHLRSQAEEQNRGYVLGKAEELSEEGLLKMLIDNPRLYFIGVQS